LSLAIMLTVAVAAVAAPLVAPYDPFAMERGQELRPPSSLHWAGTDEYGRDVLSRIVFGARVSFGVGVLAVMLGGTVGIAAGLAAGYREGWGDTLVMRVSDALLAFPAMLLGIALTALLQPGAINAALALAIISAPQFARLARAGALAEKNKEYAMAARMIGASDRRVMLRHILPNLTSSIVVQLTLAMAFAALLEAGLSFLGLGVQPPNPSWGSMLNSARTYLRDAPWYAVAPGAALSLFLLGLNFLSDSLRSALDPRARVRETRQA
jgi:ABC-type dipeptide/oligopeptide/nickel transport system permease subunit